MNCEDTFSIMNHRVFQGDLNEHETIYGGRLLELLDGTASISASRFFRVDTVTASIDELNFIAPFRMHDSLCIESYVSGAGKRSVEVFAKIIGEHLETGERYLGLTCYLTFVAMEDVSEEKEIVPLTEEEKYVCQGYQQRKAERLLKRQQQHEFQSNISLDYPWKRNRK